MRIEVKLYYYHDLDLVLLYKSGRLPFPEATRQVLNAYANKEAYKIKLLAPNQARMDRYARQEYKKFYHYHVVLDEEDDAAAIEMLCRVTPGYRNNFIKTLLRQYIGCEVDEAYFTDRDRDYFAERAIILKGTKEEAEIRQKRKSGKNTGKKTQKGKANAPVEGKPPKPKEKPKEAPKKAPAPMPEGAFGDMDDFLSGTTEQY